MLKLKSVASALVLVASAADLAAPALAAPAVVLAVSTAAHAQEAVRQETVHFGDLNLASAEGQAVLRKRVKGAVAVVCGPQADMRNFEEVADYKACVAKASAEALSQLRQQASQPAAHAG